MPVPQPTHIFRITHHRNVPWILAHGIHCRTSATQDPNFINIGNQELIDKRATRPVSIGPGGFLNDYVPFYYAPHSMMLFNIHTGRVEGVSVKQEDIVYLVSSTQKLAELNLPHVFTDGHAVTANTDYFTDAAELARLDWETIQSRDFKRRLDDLDRTRRYQAECLVHKHLPMEAILGIACKDQAGVKFIEQEVTARGQAVKVAARPAWYF